MPNRKTRSSHSSFRWERASDFSIMLLFVLVRVTEIILGQHAIPTKLLQRLMVCVACVFSVAQAQAQESRIAIFDSQSIIRESVLAKAADAKLKTEFSKRGAELENLAKKIKAMTKKLDEDAPVLSESDIMIRQREIAELVYKQQILKEDLNQRQIEEIAALVERAQKAVQRCDGWCYKIAG